MRLIVITCLVNHIEDRSALPQKLSGLPGALNLVNGPTSQPRDLKQASLLGSCRNTLQLSANRAVHGAIIPDQPASHESVHKRLHVLEIRKIPCRTIEPE